MAQNLTCHFLINYTKNANFMSGAALDVLPADADENPEDDEEQHMRARNNLDPKVIQHLERGILRAAQANGVVDPLFNAGLPDASVTTTSSTSMTSSLYTTSTSVSMESFTLDTLAGGIGSGDEIDIKTGGHSSGYSYARARCCGKARVEPIYNSGEESESSPRPNQQLSILLPPPAPEDKNKICLVLDLDETLVHSWLLSIPHADFRFVVGDEDNQIPVFVCVRPGAEQFLKELGSLYEIVIFTASIQQYADPVIDFIDPGRVVKHRLYRESCTDFGGNFVKDLSRLNRKLERIIIIDNSPAAYLLQPYNAIAISSWFDEPMDDELMKILDFLKQSYRVTNVYDLFSSH